MDQAVEEGSKEEDQQLSSSEVHAVMHGVLTIFEDRENVDWALLDRIYELACCSNLSGEDKMMLCRTGFIARNVKLFPHWRKLRDQAVAEVPKLCMGLRDEDYGFKR
jgi:hypothetical protein